MDREVARRLGLSPRNQVVSGLAPKSALVEAWRSLPLPSDITDLIREAETRGRDFTRLKREANDRAEAEEEPSQATLDLADQARVALADAAEATQLAEKRIRALGLDWLAGIEVPAVDPDTMTGAEIAAIGATRKALREAAVAVARAEKMAAIDIEYVKALIAEDGKVPTVAEIEETKTLVARYVPPMAMSLAQRAHLSPIALARSKANALKDSRTAG